MSRTGSPSRAGSPSRMGSSSQALSKEESVIRVMSRAEHSAGTASSEVADLNEEANSEGAGSFAASSISHFRRQSVARPMIDEQVLKHAPRLSPFVRALAGRCRSAALADVTLCADGVDFPCHRLVLACSSEYFASMFDEGSSQADSTAAAPPCVVKLPGKTSEAVATVLRILYFESSVQEVLAEDPRRALQVLHLAGEWQLMDVLWACTEYVRNEINDIGLLEEICLSLPYDDGFRLLRETCHDRIHNLREAEEASRQSRGILASVQSWHDDRPGRRTAGGRWPTGSGSHQWSAPVSCPRGIGW